MSAVARSPVELHYGASREIREICAWYRERSRSAEDGFLAELRHAVEQISLAPDRWPFFRVGTRRYVFNGVAVRPKTKRALTSESTRSKETASGHGVASERDLTNSTVEL